MACSLRFRYLCRRAGRQKVVAQADIHTNLNRCLSTLQMTAIGLGSTIGVGIYVLLGVAIRDYAGPAVILSFLLAGLVVLTNALIYAEFGSYIPHTGAAYTYIYCSVGELAAFLTGWMALLSMTCAAATGARAWSGMVDALFNNSIQNFLDEKMGHVTIGSPFSASLDWMAFTFFLLVTLVVSCNVHCSSIVNTVLAVLTIGVLVFATIAGPILGDIRNLSDTAHGGFMPYGYQGVVTGASAAFFAFSGFDSICIAAEESRDPVKSVPRAILIELLIVTVVYCGSAIGTLCLIPYTDIDLRAPMPSAFAYHGVTWARYVVTIGPVIAITNLSILALYSTSRIAYRMAKDRLLLSKFHYINPRTQVPLVGVIVFGILVSVISLLLELKDLVRFSVLCMLFQYIVLAPALVYIRAADFKADIAQDRNSKLDRDVSARGGQFQLSECRNPVRNPKQESSESQEPKGASDEMMEGTREASIRSRHNEDLHGAESPDRSQTSSRVRMLPAYSYVSDGDLGFGSSVTESAQVHNDYESFPFSAKNQVESSELSQSEDTTVSSSLQQSRGQEKKYSDFADESHLSEESSQSLSRLTTSGSFLNKDLSACNGTGNSGCIKATMLKFFQLLTPKLCLGLILLLLAGLAGQIGLGWADLRQGQALAVISLVLAFGLLVFLCEVIRRQCGPGKHEGFKVPGIPYLPVISCFLNMLLLVSAADVMGLIEFGVLLLLGLVVYVIMVLKQWSSSDDVHSSTMLCQEESYTLLACEDNDADSEGSL